MGSGIDVKKVCQVLGVKDDYLSECAENDFMKKEAASKYCKKEKDKETCVAENLKGQFLLFSDKLKEPFIRWGVIPDEIESELEGFYSLKDEAVSFEFMGTPIFIGLDRFRQRSADTCYEVPPSCFCGKPHWAIRVKEQKVIQGVAYAEDSVVDFWDESCSGAPSYGILEKEQDVQGMRLAAKTEVYFNSNGKLDGGTLANPQEISGLTCEGEISLHENGEIRKANLARTAVIHGIIFGVGDTGFFKNGAVEFGRLAEDQVIQGIPCAKGVLISFTSDWQLDFARLSEDTVINGVIFRKGTDISFDEGNVLYAEYKLESDEKVYGDVVPKDSTLKLDGNEIVTGISLSKITNIQGIQCDWGSVACSGDVEYRNGRVSKAILAHEQVVGGKNLPYGTTIYFDEDGGMRTVMPTR